jgi:WD40 repeat protein
VTNWLSGDLIAFRQTVPRVSNDRFLVPVAGGAVRKICDGRGGFGGDGCNAITADGRYQIARMNVEGGGRTILRELATGQDRPLTNDAVIEQVRIAPTRDNKLVAFSSDRDGRTSLYVVPTDRVPVDKPVWLADVNTNTVTTGWWTPDGLIVRIGTNEENIYRVDLDSSAQPLGRARRLTQSATRNSNPHISPDGKQIAYVSRDGGVVGIALMDANGANERLAFKSPPDLMPNGQNLGWRSATELVLFPTGGSGPLALLNLSTGVRSERGTIAGGGKRYLPSRDEIVRWSNRGVAARSLATDSDRQTAEIGGTYFASAPDLSFVIFSTDREGPSKTPLQGDLRLRNFDGSGERVLITFPDVGDGSNHAPLSVSPNGKYLIYQDPKLVLHVMELATLKSWPLLVDPPAGIDFEHSNISWAPDGSYIVLDGSFSRTELRQITGVTYDAVVRLIDGKAKK